MFWVIEWFFYTIGFAFICSMLFELWKLARMPFARSDLKVYGKGSWAVVTGSSDGIGKAFAQELASEGFNIILIARNLEKLTATSEEIKSSYGVETMIVVRDFSECNKNPIEYYTALYNEIKGKDISILVNNVGMNKRNLFHLLSLQDISNVLSVNLWPIVYLSKLLIPDMGARKSKSLIINVSSVAGFHNRKTMNIYSSTKSFDLKFSLCLQLDMNNAYPGKIDSVALTPGYVITQLTAPIMYLVISATECARGTLNSVKGRVVTEAHWKHVLMGLMMRKGYCLREKIRSYVTRAQKKKS